MIPVSARVSCATALALVDADPKQVREASAAAGQRALTHLHPLPHQSQWSVSQQIRAAIRRVHSGQGRKWWRRLAELSSDAARSLSGNCSGRTEVSWKFFLRNFWLLVCSNYFFFVLKTHNDLVHCNIRNSA